MTVPIRPVALADAPAICRIYDHYIAHTVVTFEEEPVAPAEMEGRITALVPQFPWLVAEEGGTVVGYAYASTWRTRTAYRFVAETTVYLAPEAMGRGLGASLYTALLTALRERGFHVAMGVIALPNDASVALHEKLGFAKAAHFPEVGRKFGRWVDVGYWQLML